MTTFSMSESDNTMRSEFLDVLMDFLSQDMSIEDFQKWLLGNLQIILNSGDLVMIDAANALDADLMELGEHVIEQGELIRNVDVYIRKLETIVTKTKREEGLIVETGNAQLATIERQMRFFNQNDVCAYLQFEPAGYR